MAGWSMIADDGSVLYCSETLQKSQKKGISVGVKPIVNGLGGVVKEGDKSHKLGCLFDQFTCAFLKGIFSGSCYRPLPLMLGDGKCVDLFKLFLAVKKKGGYDSVTKNRLWGSVAEESGLGSGVASVVKLIYVKYLDALERWLERVLREKKSGSGLSDVCADSDVFFMELEAELKGLLSGIADQNKKDEGSPQFDFMCGLEFTGVGESCNGAEEACSANDEDVRSMVELGGGKKCIDDDLHYNSKSGAVDDGENVRSLGNVTIEKVSARKRKRGSMQEMLNWVTKSAKNPFDPSIGVIPERSNWNSYGNDELWKQVLLARKAVLLKQKVDVSVVQSIWQTKQMMHPSMYDDHIGSGSQFTEGLRCSPRLLSVKKPQVRASPELSSSATLTEVHESSSPCMEGMEEGTSDPLPEDSIVKLLLSHRKRKRIPVGSSFQANIPEWTGVESESDSKWLGARIWPLEKGVNRCLIERDPMGKGRQDLCGCPLQGSVECVRFHIGEKSMKVRLELGSAFYLWKFDKMGENDTLSWTMEEEKKFKTIVRLNPASHKRFWDQMFKSLPNKSREDLVSYYFNVFLLHRRGDQNRFSPNSIDTDDEESEFGSVTKRLAVK